jgi:hypothetical protein
MAMKDSKCDQVTRDNAAQLCDFDRMDVDHAAKPGAVMMLMLDGPWKQRRLQRRVDRTQRGCRWARMPMSMTALDDGDSQMFKCRWVQSIGSKIARDDTIATGLIAIGACLGGQQVDYGR